MIDCKNISDNFNNVCGEEIQGGTRKTAWIFNFKDLQNYTTTTNIMVVNNFTLKSGKLIYKIIGYDGTVLPLFTYSFEQRSYDHSIQLLGFDLSAKAKENLEGMKDGLFILITENADKSFEVFGLNAGMKMNIISRAPNNADNQGAFNLGFTTLKNKEPRQPRNFLVNNYLETLEFLNNYGSDFNNDFNNDFN
jgi:hypothetical protein